MVNSAALFIGEPLLFEQDIRVYPPKVKEVITNPNYSLYVNMFTMSQEDIWDLIAEKESGHVTGKPIEGAPTPFEFLFINCHQSAQFLQQAEDAFFFFTKEHVKILPKASLVLFSDGMEELTDASQIRRIESEEQYFHFQNLIRECIGEKPIEKPNKKDHPKVALIKAKGRMRERLKKKKGNANGITLDTMLVALCCMNLNLNPLNIGEISFLAIGRLMRMMQEKERYETEMKVLTSGFASKKRKSPKYWIQNYTD